MILALTHAQGTALTILVIVVIAVALGVLVISDDQDWFD